MAVVVFGYNREVRGPFRKIKHAPVLISLVEGEGVAVDRIESLEPLPALSEQGEDSVDEHLSGIPVVIGVHRRIEERVLFMDQGEPVDGIDIGCPVCPIMYVD